MRLQLPCKALYRNFLEHTSPEPYDAIVILGVMEHLPNYRAVLR
jgi:cyclopropane-fatty-acyl-phospholipid synthase